MGIFGWSYPPGCSRTPCDEDYPEACPVCGAENSTDSGVPICDEAPDFCSIKCQDAYMQQQKDDADKYANDLEKERELAEWIGRL